MTKNRASEVDSGRKSIGRQRKGASFPAPAGKGELPADYTVLLGQIKERICSERLRVVSAANEAMVLLYWDVGKAILGRQEQEGWGAKTIDRLSHDLREAFPDLRGFSPRNLKYMRTFASLWPDREIMQQAAAQIPWFHNCVGVGVRLRWSAGALGSRRSGFLRGFAVLPPQAPSLRRSGTQGRAVRSGFCRPDEPVFVCRG